MAAGTTCLSSCVLCSRLCWLPFFRESSIEIPIEFAIHMGALIAKAFSVQPTCELQGSCQVRLYSDQKKKKGRPFPERKREREREREMRENSFFLLSLCVFFCCSLPFFYFLLCFPSSFFFFLAFLFNFV